MKVKDRGVGIANINSYGFDLIVVDKFVLLLAAKFFIYGTPEYRL